MKKSFSIFLITVFMCMSSVVFSEDTKTTAQTTKMKSVVGILTDVTSNSLTIRTEDGKEATYMRGLGLKKPEGVGKGSFVTVHINIMLNVVKSIDQDITAKHKNSNSKFKLNDQ